MVTPSLESNDSDMDQHVNLEICFMEKPQDPKEIVPKVCTKLYMSTQYIRSLSKFKLSDHLWSVKVEYSGIILQSVITCGNSL